MKNLNTIAEQLFNEIRGRFPSVELGDADGNITNEPALARFYDFEFESNGKKLGKVSVSLDEDNGVVVMFNQDFVKEDYGSSKTDWYGFLRNVRSFAKKRLLNFEVRDINRTNLTKRDYQFLATNRRGEETMAESKMYGNAKTSFQKIGNAKLSIKHTGAIEEGSSRTQKIGAIYIENADGEKFKYPFKHLSGARALAMHVSEGGNPYDDFGKHITGLSEELSNLRKFKTYMNRSSVMAESLAEHMDTVNERITSVRKTIQNLQKPQFYIEAFEEFVPIEEEEVPADVAENWIDQLTVKQFNEELKDVFPYIYKLIGEATKAQELTFEDLIAEDGINAAPATSPRPQLRPEMFDTPQEAIRAAKLAGYQEEGNDFEVKKMGNKFIFRQIGDDINIGAGGTSELAPNGQMTGSTRGVNTESAIDAAFDKILGQFADNFSSQVEGTDPVGDEDNDVDNDGDEDDSDKYLMKRRAAIAAAKAKQMNDSEEQKTPLGEFILSYFDRQTGQFPKGETAVLTSVEKDYGDQYVKPASQFIERLGQVYEKYQARKMAEFTRIQELAGLR